MYKALDLEVDEITKKNYTKLMVRSRKLNNIRKQYTLTSEQREFIDENSCFENYEKIKRFSLI